jgi:hypothetical protein
MTLVVAIAAAWVGVLVLAWAVCAAAGRSDRLAAAERARRAGRFRIDADARPGRTGRFARAHRKEGDSCAEIVHLANFEHDSGLDR